MNLRIAVSTATLAVLLAAPVSSAQRGLRPQPIADCGIQIAESAIRNPHSEILATMRRLFEVVGQCVGDCRGDGEVTIDELLIIVNIALDNTAVTECESGDANGDGTITVNEIIAAVNKALSGCGPDVSGSWQQDQAAIASSSCAAAVTAIVQENIATGDFNCTYQLVQSGAHVTITATCGGESDVTEGTVDATGRLTVTSSEQETMDGCIITLTQTTTGIVTTSPTVGTHNMEFRFAPGCGFANCTIAVQARWTKLSSSP